MTITNSSTRLAALVAGVAVALALMGAVAVAPAQAAGLSASQVSAIVSLLASFGADQATINNVTAALNGQATTGTGSGSTGGACPVLTRSLQLGSSGSDVMSLQKFLNANASTRVAVSGAGSPGLETTYFGPATQAAVIKFQAANGVSPIGVVGPASRAAIAAVCSNAGGNGGNTGGTGNTGGSVVLSGQGRLTNVTSIGDTTSDIKEGDSVTKVVGVSADATGGDVAIQRVDATFLVGSSGSQSSNLDKYVSDVSVWLDGKKLATMNASDADKTSGTRIWTLRFANLNGVIKEGHTGNLYIEVTPISSVGINEAGKGATAKILANGIRAVGADGISETYVANDVTNAFTISTQTTGTLTVTAGSDNPNASQVAVSSSTTSGVTLLTFNMKAKNSDINVNTLEASFGTNDALTDVVSTVKLMKGSTVLSSKTVTGTTYGTVSFNNLHEVISKDSTANYSIVADLKGDSAYADGTTLIASTTVANSDVSDQNGNTVTPSAAAIGNTMTLTAAGISVTKGSITTSTTVGLSGSGDTTQYTIPFTVTAGDSDVYIGSTVTRLASASTAPSGSATGINFATTTSSTASSTYAATTNFAASNVVTGDVAGAYKVPAGTSRTFTLNVSFTAASTGYTGVQLVGINYGPTSSLGSTYYTSNLDSFKTTDILMKLR